MERNKTGEAKEFHISDLISVTTGRLVSAGGVGGLYHILNWMTDDNLFTHQLPRGIEEACDVLWEEYSFLMPDHPRMAGLVSELSLRLEGADDNEHRREICDNWVKDIQAAFDLPDKITLYKGEAKEAHKNIDPLDELDAMMSHEEQGE